MLRSKGVGQYGFKRNSGFIFPQIWNDNCNLNHSTQCTMNPPSPNLKSASTHSRPRSELILMPMLILMLFLTLTLVSQTPFRYSEAVTKRVFTDLTVALEQPNKVFNLDLSGQHFSEFPEVIFYFRNLQVLRMDSVGLHEVHWQKGRLENLICLGLSGNELTQFTIPPGHLPRLEELFLDVNQLSAFPQIENPSIALKTLSLRQNNITHIPLNYKELRNLQYLFLDSNPLKNAEEAFYLSNQLERLSLFDTGLTSLKIDQVQHKLVKLVISDNPIQFDDWNPELFPQIDYLDVSYNFNLDESFWNKVIKLRNMRFFVAEGAKITTIPNSFGSLQSLMEISLLGNRLRELPDGFYFLELRLVNLEFNPLIEEEEKLLKAVFGKQVIL